MKYRKRPVVIEAEQYTAENIFKIFYWLGSHHEANMPVTRLIYKNEAGEVIINTLEGQMKVNEGDFVIKGVNGEFYPCKPDIFEKTYEPVTD